MIGNIVLNLEFVFYKINIFRILEKNHTIIFLYFARTKSFFFCTIKKNIYSYLAKSLKIEKWP